MQFSEIPGQEAVKARLKALAASGRVPHALLLEGPAGSYKLALARAFAQRLHCRNPLPDGDSCGKCIDCRRHRSLDHIDTVYVYPVVKSDAIKEPVSDDFAPTWREFVERSPEADIDVWTGMFDKKNAHPTIYVYESAALIRKLSLTSHGSDRRVVIVWLPERMNEETANKLLKIIEEPPSQTVFVMASDAPDELLPTIYSRMQRIAVGRLTDGDVTRALVGRGIDPDEAMQAAALSDGSISRAMGLAAGGNGARGRHHTRFVELMRLAYGRRVYELREWALALAGVSRDEQQAFYANAQRLVRENFVYNLGEPSLCNMTADEDAFSRNFARFVTEANVEKLIETFQRAATDIAGNANARIVNYDVALRVCFLLKSR